MKIEIETKYGFGQKAYVVDHDRYFNFRVVEVHVNDVVTHHVDMDGKHESCVMYGIKPRTEAHGGMVKEHVLHETPLEAQEEAELLDRAFNWYRREETAL